jgi:voltage-gated potassium channel
MSFNYRIFKKIYLFLFLMVGIIGTGTLGYISIEGWGFFDSFYMTIITMSTVGFGEVHELSDQGRLFTAFLLISCFGIFAYTISSLTSYIVGGEYRSNLRDYKILRIMKTMENHVIVCGFGRVGKQVASDLLLFRIPFVIVENDEAVIKENEADHEFIFIKGDATREGILEKANLQKARGVITCLPKDVDNVYVALASREAQAQLNVVARASLYSAVSKLKLAGANHVIMPDSIGGSHMASLIGNPDIIEFMDAIKVQGHSGVNIETISFSELPEEFRNKTIGQLEAKRITGVTIIGFKTPDGEYIINPDFETEVVPHSKLFVLGSAEQIRKLNSIFGIQH